MKTLALLTPPLRWFLLATVLAAGLVWFKFTLSAEGPPLAAAL